MYIDTHSTSLNMSKRLAVKFNRGREEVTLDQSASYDDFVRILAERRGLAEGKTFTFLAKGKAVTRDTFSTVENGTTLLAINTRVPRDPVYSYDQVKASMIVFLDFIRMNPQMSDMYKNDYGQLVTEMIHNPTVNDVIKNILEQSGHIMEAMRTGKNIKLNIGSGGDVDEVNLSKEDDNNIQELMDMGFDPVKVIKTYVENKNDKEKTLDILMHGA
jgi:hypothetical protein